MKPLHKDRLVAVLDECLDWFQEPDRNWDLDEKKFNEAKDQIKALFIELVGEDEPELNTKEKHRYKPISQPNFIRNQLRAELRKRIEDI